MEVANLKTLTVNDWQNALAQVKGVKADVVPSGWKTARQIAEETKTSYSMSASRIVGPLILAGMAECKKFRILTPSGIIRPIPHYRLIK